MASNIAEALRQCNSYAEKGYKLAKSSYEEIHQALLQEEQKVLEANRRQNQMTRIANSSVLQRQNNNFEEFKHMDLTLKNDLDLLHRNQKEFSIVVFGRTMAGKSTLMEILTHGNGASIGKGAQRTTRDVRDYHWQGMKITDVPGIASFDGREDDRLAMEAAKKADLILFLITDDAPQKDEAEKLAELRSLGKPVLGIVNVKLALNMERKALALRNLQKKLSDTARLNEICKQFKAYATQFNQDWQEMPFIYTHLRAAFLGQSSQLNDVELYNMSNFSQVEKYIIDKVCKDGCFLRIKTFIDNVAVPMQQRMELLLEHSSINIKEALVYRGKWNKLWKWRQDYVDRSQKKYNKFVDQLYEMIESEIYDFAEDNYDNEYAGEAWNKRVESMHLENLCRDFLQELSNECERKRRELTDELRTEIKFSSFGADASNIQMEGVTDTQGLLQMGALGIGLIFSGPIGIALGILSFFFEDKAEKIRKQKEELIDKLKEAMQPVLNKIDDYLLKEMSDNILKNGIDKLVFTLADMDDMLFDLANEERKMAKDLNYKLFNLNADLFIEATNYLQENLTYSLYNMARIPGQVCFAFGTNIISENMCKKLSSLLEEQVVYISIIDPEKDNEAYTDKINNIITKWMGDWEFKKFQFSEDGEIWIIYLKNIKPFQTIKNEINYRLMEQIYCEPINLSK
ncbi:GTPase [Megamonas hypermegale]|uniref:GTPase n=1 Tax=Megamonas hypermegale TaxID=158847 RepID=UPI00195E8696|nr:GTPase [Megamonas hypermegale]MBM6833902.1 50S ribosome-binding GTPase [Megamonas hypermegale]